MIFKPRQKQTTFSTDPKNKLLPQPSKSSKFLPDWFAKIPRQEKGSDPLMSGTVKTCIPFIEAMTEGITIPLWADLNIVVTEHFDAFDEFGNKLTDDFSQLFRLPINSDLNFIGMPLNGGIVSEIKSVGLKTSIRHPHQSNFGVDIHSVSQLGSMRVPNNAPRCFWKLHSPWRLQTPKGWSTYYKNPANNFDNDLHIFEGLVDTDTYTNSVNFPCVWTGTEEGSFVIDRGTPIAQLLFINREQEDLSLNVEFKEEDSSVTELLSSKFINRYRDLFWHKRKK